MNCPKCGTQNPDDTQVCSSCSSELPKASVGTGKLIPRTSGLAIAAFVLGILSLFTCGLTAIPAIVLGIISFILVERSGGRLTGRNFAVLGVVLPIVLSCGIVVPGILKIRKEAFRMVCATNLSGIGMAMLTYANDYDDELPRSGAIDSTWSKNIPNWKASNRFVAYGLKADGSGGQANISSCLYLLVKYTDVTPKWFICKGDTGATEFRPSYESAGNIDLINLWDFGPEPAQHCSYAYHQPFSKFPLTTSSEPGMAVAADRNPWMDSPTGSAKTMAGPPPFDPDGDKEAVQVGNAIAHHEDGQNVLFLDRHVGFEKRPFCGINDDNIYTYWDGGDIKIGAPPTIVSEPQGKLDSLLVHDGP